MNINRLLGEDLLSEEQLEKLLPYLFATEDQFGRHDHMIGTVFTAASLCRGKAAPNPKGIVHDKDPSKYHPIFLKQILVAVILYKEDILPKAYPGEDLESYLEDFFQCIKLSHTNPIKIKLFQRVRKLDGSYYAPKSSKNQLKKPVEKLYARAQELYLKASYDLFDIYEALA